MTAAQALEDAWVGLIVLTGLFFAPTLLLFASAGIDKLASTSVSRVVDAWLLEAKLAAITAEMLWAALFLAPAGVLSWSLNGSSAERTVAFSWIRPVVNAIGVYAAVFLCVAAVRNMPSSLQGPLEFEIPRPEIYRARLAMLELRVMALQCMKDASPPRCSRPDVWRIQAQYYLKWLEEMPGAFEGERDWG
jgi:hypothetical protein